MTIPYDLCHTRPNYTFQHTYQNLEEYQVMRRDLPEIAIKSTCKFNVRARAEKVV